jgi:uncharacterized coiled-coil protein SlyX
MSDHEHFEELAALSAAGLLSGREVAELREHSQSCSECRNVETEFSEIVRSALPLTANPVGEFLRQRKVVIDDGVRDRFLSRARSEGIAFSPGVSGAVRQPARFRDFLAAFAATAALILVVLFGPEIYQRVRSPKSQQTVAQLELQNAALNQNISQLNQSLAAQQEEIQKLQAKLGIAVKTSESLRAENAHGQTEMQQASSQIVQFPNELASRDKQLEDARNEIQRINKLQDANEASLVAQQVRIAELSDQLRVASATLDMERQLTASGKDIRELLTARQLHVIDVRDIDANGKAGRAFGRIFVTEGKSLTFYAFDLNDRTTDAKRRYEVWGSQAKGGAPKRLGFFSVDDKAQGRWSAKVSDPRLIGEVSSVFVTVEPSANSGTPTGQPLLYANLGRTNHP